MTTPPEKTDDSKPWHFSNPGAVFPPALKPPNRPVAPKPLDWLPIVERGLRTVMRLLQLENRRRPPR